MSSPSDDLAHTATAASGPAKTGELAPGGTLGRYRIERELGAGGMGVVYAAIDPDLERRVALKVLKRDSGAGRERLLREARAMARLDHPNVVDIYEVGSVGGTDYIAMELVDGGSLQDWLRADTRTPKEIVDAFVAAGHGLASAHAAGLVHRDFKPHNVLRGRDGRVCVTDFGLARDATDEGTPDSAALTARMLARTPLSGLTNTGAMVGTPAYMAPEQWRGERASAAADQFAFAVALWEALNGERPYKGKTAVELAEQTAAGPSKLPRTLAGWLHRALCRALEPDPAKRYPSMAAMLRHIVPRRWPWVTIGIVAVVVIAGLIAVQAVLEVRSQLILQLPQPCYAAERPDLPAEKLAKLAPAVQRRIENDLMAWSSTRGSACTSAGTRRDDVLACFDAVTMRIAFVLDPPPRLPARSVEQTLAFLLPPKICANTRAHFARELTSEACIRVIDGDADIAAAQACGDDALLAQLALDEVRKRTPQTSDWKIAVEAARVLVTRVGAPQLVGQLEVYDAQAADAEGHYDEARALEDKAVASFIERSMIEHQIDTVIASVHARLDRALPNDLADARQAVVSWRLKAGPRILELDRADALARFAQGDVKGAHDELVASWTFVPGPFVITGTVSDGGAPVEGAVVAAGPTVMADAIGLVPYDPAGDLRMATTDAHGAFRLETRGRDVTIVAQHGAHRSLPVAATDKPMALSLAPTRRVLGKLWLGTSPSTQATAYAQLGTLRVIAPVDTDGRFELAGVPTERVEIGAAVAGIGVATIPVGPGTSETAVELRITPSRK